MVWAAIDFETTGTVAGWPNEPWQVGIVKISDGRVLPETEFESLMHVGDRPFSPRAVGRYSEMRDALAAAPAAMEIFPEISSALCGVPVVAHNCATERSVLAKLAPMTAFGPWMDTLAYARARYPSLESYALGDLVAGFGLKGELDLLCPGRDWHDALYDACACALLACRFIADGWRAGGDLVQSAGKGWT